MIAEPEMLVAHGATAALYRDAPSFDGLRTASIGKVSFDSAESGRALLEEIAERIRAEGFRALLGPMDGDTWHSYRVVTESDGSPPFALEPVSGAFDRDAFEAAGFAPVSSYVSSLARLADTLAAEPVAIEGVSVEAWDGQNAEHLIGGLFQASLASFSRNRFFKPIGLDAFLELYRPILPLIDPRHVLFARDGGSGELVGFLFGMPDRLASQRPAAILKTYASSRRGIGHLLADTYHRRAIDLGYEDVIHALMHEDNVSRDRSARHGATIFRRYALFGRKL